MKYSKEILERVMGGLENDKIRNEAEAEARRRAVYEKLPRVGEIDIILRTTVLDIIRASFGKGEDTKALIAKTREKNLALSKERAELLLAAGIAPETLEDKPLCEACNDTGYAGGELCKCVISRYKHEVARVINKNLNIKPLSFSDFDISLYPERGGKLCPRAQMREVLEFVQGWAESFGEESESLFFSGGTGLGKTFLAKIAARTVADLGFSVVYDTAFSVLGTYEAVKFGRSEEDTSLFEECDLLILDDVGNEMRTPFSIAALLNIINSRANAGLSTVVISSLSEPEIKKDYGAPLYSRLAGDFIKLEFLGEDVRLKR